MVCDWRRRGSGRDHSRTGVVRLGASPGIEMWSVESPPVDPDSPERTRFSVSYKSDEDMLVASRKESRKTWKDVPEQPLHRNLNGNGLKHENEGEHKENEGARRGEGNGRVEQGNQRSSNVEPAAMIPSKLFGHSAHVTHLTLIGSRHPEGRRCWSRTAARRENALRLYHGCGRYLSR